MQKFIGNKSNPSFEKKSMKEHLKEMNKWINSIPETADIRYVIANFPSISMIPSKWTGHTNSQYHKLWWGELCRLLVIQVHSTKTKIVLKHM